MIAASYRRAGNYQQALAAYQSTHQRFPDNVDCLKFLVRLCSELESETGQLNYGQLLEQYSELLRRLEKTHELREEQKLTSSRSTSRNSNTAGNKNKSNLTQGSSSSREGSAATTSSNASGSGSSGYMTSFTPINKSITPKSSPKSMNKQNGKLNNDNISAIVDQVVEQFDSSTERPTTSWRRNNLKSSHGRGSASDHNHHDTQQLEFDEDFLIDANIDEMLPD